MCIFADWADLSQVESLLARLPRDVYGQIFVTSAGASWPVEVPCRMQVSWLAPGADALADAIAAWSAEWLVDEDGLFCQTPVVWVMSHAAAALSGSATDGMRRLVTALPSTHLAHGFDGTLPEVFAETSTGA